MKHLVALRARLHTAGTALQHHWQRLSPRERLGFGALGLLLGGWLSWALAVQPALQTLRDGATQRTQLAQQLQHMQALQAQARQLQQQTALPPQEALERLKQLTKAADPGLQLTPNNDLVTVQVTAVPASALAGWLTQARHQAQALPTEAHLSRASATDPGITWNGRIVLRLPSRESRH